MLSYLSDEEDNTLLTREMKRVVREDIKHYYEDKEVELLLNPATYLDPRFKDSFVALEDDVKQGLLEQAENADDGAGASSVPQESLLVQDIPHLPKTKLTC